MKILHTSDWHLGHTLHEHDRGDEHDAFLAWLIGTLVAREIDVLMVAGDVFETANPPAAAQRRWYRFLADARCNRPDLDIVVIGGNHDSAARIDAPRDLLDHLGVHVVGGLPRRADGTIDTARLVVPLRDRDGGIGAWVAAVPFLRVADLPRVDGDEDSLVGGVRQIYDHALDAARAQRQPGQAILAMGHCYMTGGQISELSERRILGGNQHALPVDIFPDDVAYTALGHLHLAQRVGHERVRYAGSPIPLSFGERDYAHQVLIAELARGELSGVESVRVPRTVDLLRVPADAPGPKADVLAALGRLPGRDATRAAPFLEVRVRLDGPEPGLRALVDEALRDRGVRLAALFATISGSGQGLEAVDDLRELDVAEVFRRCWAARYSEPPGEAELAGFHELVEAAYAEERA